MERRKFLLIASVGTATATMPIWACNYGSLEYDQSLARPELLSRIWDPETIVEIGKRYQEEYPGESSERELVELLSESISTKGDDVPASIKKRIKEDFETGKIVMLEGWVLSLTEVRQCALFSLTQLN